MRTVIGLVGGAGVGKDTIANYLQTQLVANKISIAYDISTLASKLYGVPPHFFTDRTLKDEVFYPVGRTPRELTCLVGDALAKTYGDTFSVEQVGEHIQKHWGGTAIVTDVRYAHEAVAIRKWSTTRGLYVVLLKVLRPGVAPTNAHRSELDWPSIECDFAVRNDGDLRDLHVQLDEFMCCCVQV